MSRDTASRDVTLNVLSAMTGCITAVALVGTGLIAGLAADQTAQKAQAKKSAKAARAGLLAATSPARTSTGLPRAATAPPLRPKPLPVRIVVTTRYIQAVAPAAQYQVPSQIRLSSQGRSSSQYQGSSRKSGGNTSYRPTRLSGPTRAAAPAPSRPQAVTRVSAPPPPAPSAAS